MIANWYEDKNDYIAPHSDCKKGMIENAKISILSLYPSEDTNNFRTLTLKSKINNKLFEIRLDHGLIVSMCGTTQNDFTHEISKCTNDVSPRISLSFRQMTPNLIKNSEETVTIKIHHLHNYSPLEIRAGLAGRFQ